MAKDTKERILTAAPGMLTRVFSGMTDKDPLRRDDPAMPAFACTMPVSALIRLHGREPEKTEDAVRKTETFSRHFIAACGVKQRCLIRTDIWLI